MPKAIKNRTTRADRIRKIKAGLQKYYATTDLVLAGTSYKPGDLQTFLQADVDANDAATKARASWIQAANVAKSTDTATDPALRAIRSQVQTQYGEAPNADTVFADFGYARKKRATNTAEEKAAAAAKRKATREARHTMGPKAKAQVHGVVPATRAAAEEPAAVNPTPAPVVTSNPASTSSQGASPSGSTNKSSP